MWVKLVSLIQHFSKQIWFLQNYVSKILTIDYYEIISICYHKIQFYNIYIHLTIQIK